MIMMMLYEITKLSYKNTNTKGKTHYHLSMRGSKRDTDVQNGLLDSVGEGEGGMIWESGTVYYCQSMFDIGYRMLGAGARG